MRLTLIALLLAGPVAMAAPLPIVLSHTGYVLGANDVPLSRGGAVLALTLWDGSAAGANRVWPATGSNTCVVDVLNGYYTAVLDGSQASGCGALLTTAHAPPGQVRWLELSIDGVTLSPRARLVSAPTAVLAQQSLDTQALIAALLATGAVNAGTNPVDWTQLKNVPPAIAAGDGFTGVTLAAGSGLAGNGTPGAGLTLAPTSVAAGTYQNATISVDAQGRLTTAADGGTLGTAALKDTGTTSGTVPLLGASGRLTITGLVESTTGGFRFPDGTIQATAAGPSTQWTTEAGGSLSFTGGRVGIGTSTPGAVLDVGGTEAIRIPTGTSAQRPSTPVAGMIRLNTTTGKLEFYNGVWTSVGGTTALGGNSVADVGGFRIHTFTSSGTLTVVGGVGVEVLVVGGGGGGAGGAGGGGGGGVVYDASFPVTTGVITVTVGGGGAGAGWPSDGANGGNSSFSTLVAFGGGGGAHGGNGVAGGSGGGGGYSGVGGAGTSGQGYAGGSGIAVANGYPGGGGGGAGGGGGNASGQNAGNGGPGFASSISGAAANYGGGGGGNTRTGASSGTGGLGGGGNGTTGGNGLPGAANTGGGGGAGATTGGGYVGGTGGSGLVIVRYPL